MTNKEAILMLDRIMYDADYRGIEWATGAKEAFEMAIEALKAQDVPDTNVGDMISMQAAIDALRNINAIVSPISDDVLLIDKAEAMTELMMLPSAQAEQSNASEFWRKRADFYSDMCMNLIGEMGKGVKIESVKISENGIEFIKEQPSARPEIPPYVAEIEAEYKKWINVPYIRKPLAKALYEVWKKHDMEAVERRTNEND